MRVFEQQDCASGTQQRSGAVNLLMDFSSTTYLTAKIKRKPLKYTILWLRSVSCLNYTHIQCFGKVVNKFENKKVNTRSYMHLLT